jgi:catechol 2,3-dioxygenase-like lactoylglutathione lyase family enzyme
MHEKGFGNIPKAFFIGEQSMSQNQWAVEAIEHVQLAAPAGCEAAARQFYGELLGLPEIPKPASLARRGGIWFQVGQQGLHIGVESTFNAAKKAHPAFLVRDVNALAERLAAADVTVEWDDALPGYHRFYASDPWGNRLEFLTPSKD